MSSVIGDVQANIDKVENLVREYLPSESDVLVLPEVWTVGWACTHFRETAQNVESGSVHDFLSNLAKTHNINIIGGSYITEKMVNITILVRFSIVRGNLLLVILKCICIHIMDAMRVNM